MEEYTFRGQRQGETVQLVAKQHGFLLVPILYVWAVAIGLIVAAEALFGATKYSSWVIIVAVIFGLFSTWYRWFLWVNGMCIITSQRVVKIVQKGIFSRHISEAEISNIQEVTTEIVGPMKTMLNFGTVVIQTASSKGRLDIDNVADPYDIQQIIVGLQRKTISSAGRLSNIVH